MLALTLEAEWGRLACKIVSISPVFPFFHLFCHGSPGLFEMFGDRKLSSQQPKGRFGHMNTTEKHSFYFGLAPDILVPPGTPWYYYNGFQWFSNPPTPDNLVPLILQWFSTFFFTPVPLVPPDTIAMVSNGFLTPVPRPAPYSWLWWHHRSICRTRKKKKNMSY